MSQRICEHLAQGRHILEAQVAEVETGPPVIAVSVPMVRTVVGAEMRCSHEDEPEFPVLGLAVPLVAVPPRRDEAVRALCEAALELAAMHGVPDVELGWDVSRLLTAATLGAKAAKEVEEGEAEEGVLFVFWQRSFVGGSVDAVQSPTVCMEAGDGKAGDGARAKACCAAFRRVFVLLEGVGVYPVALLGDGAPVGTPAGQAE